jgi:hypothetical protein
LEGRRKECGLVDSLGMLSFLFVIVCGESDESQKGIRMHKKKEEVKGKKALNTM